jgi:GNAT superfamily N-acetyltransferase
MSIEITPATPDDVPTILSLIGELAEYENLLDTMRATEESLRRDLFGPRPFAEVLMGRLNGTSVGYALFFHSYSTFLAQPGIYLEDVYVRRDARGAGVGKALLRAVARIAGERKCGRLEFSVLDWNQPSIDFYLGLGAAPLGDWTMYRFTEPGIERLVQG